MAEPSSKIPLSHFTQVAKAHVVFSKNGVLADEEFKQLSEVDNKYWKEKETAFESALQKHNIKKNRYIDVLPNEETRVVIKTSKHGYINANYIQGKEFGIQTDYIATQGPIPETIGDFWRMVVEQKVRLILMVAKECESGKIKCEKYWPSKSVPLHFDEDNEKTNMDPKTTHGISVELASEEEAKNGAIVTRKLLVHCNGETREVVMLHFMPWPDHGVPNDPSDFLHLVELADLYWKNHPSSPIVIHCSAGIGRTGTFCTVDIVLKQVKKQLAENVPKDKIMIDVFSIVRKLREHRAGMVQMPGQYRFIYTTLAAKLISY
jgi:receptor-type tyrosine-protein phosphatase eta